ncbi:MAG: alpha/beta hydrolase [Cupriavidus sp.]|nr:MULTISPECIES: alpha/beta hydrolase [unclassified Methylobacterium]KOX43891.1 hydrolase [Streptomyces purpurogeneiscleroticus]MBU69252.1 alpha/beta hydrolase [Cupriavidus sp.]MBP30320.1 alpha/beta hydrolase [Methylobacterium sp.]MDE4909253.1 alpha/beta hydrolase [Methylobacterium sp. 092160098-2]WFS08312.1 alpha/beta hydrolase [Methylobacterium sp. 391_Methyba4]
MRQDTAFQDGPARTTRRCLLAGSVMAAGLGPVGAVAAETRPAEVAEVRHGTVRADGVDVFYREAGRPDAPVFLLLHGFANSSFYFRHLMPRLADRFRLIAPDLPSFGFTVVPDDRGYVYDFASLSRTIKAFVDVLGLRRYRLYTFDYGAPVGWDLALAHPDRIAGIVSQNGNAYLEGLGEAAWAPLRTYWEKPNEAAVEAIRARMTLDGVKAPYFHGVPDPSVIEPESYTLDAAILARPGNADRQVKLKLDYKRNLERYPLIQAFFRERRPRLLAVWGRNDPFFIPPGAEAFKRDIPDARVRFLDTGHFALETNGDDIAREIRAYF